MDGLDLWAAGAWFLGGILYGLLCFPLGIYVEVYLG